MTKRKLLRKDITNFITNLEVTYNLLEWKVNGVFIWQTSRVRIYLLINEFLTGKATTLLRTKLLDKLKLFHQRLIINSIFFNPFIDFHKAESLVFESGRKYLCKDKYIDIYTEYFCDDLKRSNISFTKYELNHTVDNLNRNKSNIKHLDFILIGSRIISHFIKVRLSIQDKTKINEIQRILFIKFGIKINLTNIFINEIKKFKSEYPFYKALFRLKKSKNVYLINSCYKASLIRAAKDCNIIVSELQHGLMAKEDLIEHFPYTIEDSLQYFPDKFYVWDNINMFMSKLPLSKNNIIKFENKHLKFIKESSKNIIQNTNQILIISQPELTTEILQFVLNNIIDMPLFQFILKIHPMEESYFYNNLFAQKLKEFPNLIIVDNKFSIYELFIESSYVIGVYSAAMFEATYFGCQTLLLNLPGVEMATILVKDHHAILVETNFNLMKLINFYSKLKDN